MGKDLTEEMFNFGILWTLKDKIFDKEMGKESSVKAKKRSHIVLQ